MALFGLDPPRWSRSTLPLGLGLLLLASTGSAEPKTALHVYRAPGAEDCPDAEALAKKVDAIVGREVIGPGPGDHTAWIEVNMQRLEQGYSATVHTFGHNVGRREISDAGPDCSGLGEAVAVSLALMWSSDTTTPAAEPEETELAAAELGSGRSNIDQPEPARTPEAGPPQPKKPQSRPKGSPAAPGKTESKRYGVEALLGAALGVLEHPVPGAELATRLGLGAVAFNVGVGAFGVDRLEAAGGSVELALGYAYLGGCLRLTKGTPGWGFCLRPMLGTLRGKGSGFDRSSSESLLYTALSAAVELAGDLSTSFGYGARVVAVAPLSRGGFSVSDVNGVEPVFSIPSLGMLALVGLSWGNKND